MAPTEPFKISYEHLKSGLHQPQFFGHCLVSCNTIDYGTFNMQ